jgi:hypothetical protein
VIDGLSNLRDAQQAIFDPGEIKGHATSIGQLQQQLAEAHEAAKTMVIAEDGFGILCRPFAWLLKPVEQWGTDTIAKAVEALDSVAANLAASAQAYQEMEDGNAAMFQQILDEMPDRAQLRTNSPHHIRTH